MDATLKNDNEFIQTLFSQLSESCTDETLRLLFISYENLFSSVTDDILQQPIFIWNQITRTLFHLSMVKKLFSRLFTLRSFVEPSICNCMKSIIKTVFSLAIFPEVSLSHCAQVTLSYLILMVFKNSAIFDENLKLVLDLIMVNAAKQFIGCIKIFTVFIRQAEANDSIVPDIFFDYLTNFCNTYLKGRNCSNHGDFHASICLVKELLSSDNTSPELCDVIHSVVADWLENVDLHCVHPAYRLKYLQIAKSSLAPKGQKYIRRSAFSCFAMINQVSNELIADKPYCVGFDSPKLSAEELSSHVSFSKCEAMILLNNILNALFIIVEEEKEMELKLNQTTNLFERFQLNDSASIINFFFEQDDLMIDFLLHHLSLSIALEKKNMKLIHSPHIFFSGMLHQLSFDSGVLLDWLTSNETQFLLYLLQYLKHVTGNFKEFSATYSSDPDKLVAVFATLKSLRLSIEKLCAKDLFPYPVTPLLRVMNTVEHLANG